jgi:hypothetical protein
MANAIGSENAPAAMTPESTGDATRLTGFIGIKKTCHRPIPRAGHRHGTLSIKPTS